MCQKGGPLVASGPSSSHSPTPLAGSASDKDQLKTHFKLEPFGFINVDKSMKQSLFCLVPGFVFVLAFSVIVCIVDDFNLIISHHCLFLQTPALNFSLCQLLPRSDCTHPCLVLHAFRLCAYFTSCLVVSLDSQCVPLNSSPMFEPSFCLIFFDTFVWTITVSHTYIKDFVRQLLLGLEFCICIHFFLP